MALLTSAMADFGAPLGSRLPYARPYTRFYAHSVGHWLGERSRKQTFASSSAEMSALIRSNANSSEAMPRVMQLWRATATARERMPAAGQKESLDGETS